MDSLKFPHLGAMRGEGQTSRVMVHDKVGYNILGPHLSVTEAIEILPPCEIEEAFGHSIQFPLDIHIKELGVKKDLVRKYAVNSAQAIAWERRSTKGVAVSIDQQVGVVDACSSCSKYYRVSPPSPTKNT